MEKTNVFIAGACKSGTSFLHQFLSKQQHICGSVPKEPYFFELPISERHPQTYFEKYFPHYAGETYLVDGRHRNMFFNWAPKAIHDYNPSAKIIFILRNPVERAFSHWWMWYSRGILKKSFHKTVASEIQRLKQNKTMMTLSPEAYQTHIKSHSFDKRIAYADAGTVVESGLYFTQIELLQ